MLLFVPSYFHTIVSVKIVIIYLAPELERRSQRYVESVVAHEFAHVLAVLITREKVEALTSLMNYFKNLTWMLNVWLDGRRIFSVVLSPILGSEATLPSMIVASSSSTVFILSSVVVSPFWARCLVCQAGY